MTTKGKLTEEEAGADCYEKMRSMQLAPTSAVHVQAKDRNGQAGQGFYIRADLTGFSAFCRIWSFRGPQGEAMM